LRDQVTEPERFTIEAHYYAWAAGDWDKAIESADLWARTYPRSADAHATAGMAHWIVGELEIALREELEAYRLEPRDWFYHSGAIYLNIVLDRLDEAKGIAESELALNPDGAGLHAALLWIAFIQSDHAAADRQIQWFRGRPMEHLGLHRQIQAAKMRGQLRRADELLRKANDLRQLRRLPPIPEPSAEEHALLGNCAPTRTASIASAVALALCGDVARIQQALKRVEERQVLRPGHSANRPIDLPIWRATLELTRDQPNKAIEILQPLMHYERAHPSVVYLRGLAYLRARKGAEAATEFQKIADHRGTYWGHKGQFGPLYAVSYVGLAHSATLEGDTTRAKKAFQDFFALWKDADPDIPILIEARKEYAALN
jgi:tetratricopeptide (TPR) repeat protein